MKKIDKLAFNYGEENPYNNNPSGRAAFKAGFHKAREMALEFMIKNTDSFTKERSSAVQIFYIGEEEV